jgi:hypothetical protein
MWQSWVNLLVGIWLMLSGIIPSIHSPASMIVGGIVAAICGFWAGAEKWPGIVTGFVGVWLIICGAWLALAVTWNFVIFGIIVGLLAIWNLSSPPHGTPAPRSV